MRRPHSLQGRLALWLGLGVTLLWVLAAATTAGRLSAELDQVYDGMLSEAAQRLLPLAVRDILARDTEDAPDQRVDALRIGDQFLSWVVRDSSGVVLMHSHGADAAAFPPFAGIGFSETATHRIYSDAALRGSITIAVGEPFSHRHAALRGVVLGLAAPLLLILPFGLFLVWLVVRLSLAPLRRFRAGIAARGAGDLTPVPDEGLPAEILPNAVAVNQLLERLRRTLEAERSFTANSAHELRTPVAAALAQVQRLIIEAPDETTRSRAQAIETALRRLSRLSEKLMQLARAEGGASGPAEPVDLVPILRLVLHDLDTRDGRIVASLPETPAIAAIDTDAFAILARNLIENALKHGDPAAPVRVMLATDGSFAVRNAGPVVAPEVLRRLSQRFTRGTTTAEGAGLGLAIAATIATSSGGRLELTSPPTGETEGFEARLSFGGK